VRRCPPSGADTKPRRADHPFDGVERLPSASSQAKRAG
jgi:hypothetical protein